MSGPKNTGTATMLPHPPSPLPIAPAPRPSAPQFLLRARSQHMHLAESFTDSEGFETEPEILTASLTAGSQGPTSKQQRQSYPSGDAHPPGARSFSQTRRHVSSNAQMMTVTFASANKRAAKTLSAHDSSSEDENISAAEANATALAAQLQAATFASNLSRYQSSAASGRSNSGGGLSTGGHSAAGVPRSNSGGGYSAGDSLRPPTPQSYARRTTYNSGDASAGSGGGSSTGGRELRDLTLHRQSHQLDMESIHQHHAQLSTSISSRSIITPPLSGHRHSSGGETRRSSSGGGGTRRSSGGGTRRSSGGGGSGSHTPTPPLPPRPDEVESALSAAKWALREGSSTSEGEGFSCERQYIRMRSRGATREDGGYGCSAWDEEEEDEGKSVHSVSSSVARVMAGFSTPPSRLSVGGIPTAADGACAPTVAQTTHAMHISGQTWERTSLRGGNTVGPVTVHSSGSSSGMTKSGGDSATWASARPMLTDVTGPSPLPYPSATRKATQQPAQVPPARRHGRKISRVSSSESSLSSSAEFSAGPQPQTFPLSVLPPPRRSHHSTDTASCLDTANSQQAQLGGHQLPPHVQQAVAAATAAVMEVATQLVVVSVSRPASPFNAIQPLVSLGAHNAASPQSHASAGGYIEGSSSYGGYTGGSSSGGYRHSEDEQTPSQCPVFAALFSEAERVRTTSLPGRHAGMEPGRAGGAAAAAAVAATPGLSAYTTPVVVSGRRATHQGTTNRAQSAQPNTVYGQNQSPAPYPLQHTDLRSISAKTGRGASSASVSTAVTDYSFAQPNTTTSFSMFPPSAPTARKSSMGDPAVVFPHNSGSSDGSSVGAEPQVMRQSPASLLSQTSVGKCTPWSAGLKPGQQTHHTITVGVTSHEGSPPRQGSEPHSGNTSECSSGGGGGNIGRVRHPTPTRSRNSKGGQAPRSSPADTTPRAANTQPLHVAEQLAPTHQFMPQPPRDVSPRPVSPRALSPLRGMLSPRAVQQPAVPAASEHVAASVLMDWRAPPAIAAVPTLSLPGDEERGHYFAGSCSTSSGPSPDGQTSSSQQTFGAAADYASVNTSSHSYLLQQTHGRPAIRGSATEGSQPPTSQTPPALAVFPGQGKSQVVAHVHKVATADVAVQAFESRRTTGAAAFPSERVIPSIGNVEDGGSVPGVSSQTSVGDAGLAAVATQTSAGQTRAVDLVPAQTGQRSPGLRPSRASAGERELLEMMVQTQEPPRR